MTQNWDTTKELIYIILILMFFLEKYLIRLKNNSLLNIIQINYIAVTKLSTYNALHFCFPQQQKLPWTQVLLLELQDPAPQAKAGGRSLANHCTGWRAGGLLKLLWTYSDPSGPWSGSACRTLARVITCKRESLFGTRSFQRRISSTPLKGKNAKQEKLVWTHWSG